MVSEQTYKSPFLQYLVKLSENEEIAAWMATTGANFHTHFSHARR